MLKENHADFSKINIGSCFDLLQLIHQIYIITSNHLLQKFTLGDRPVKCIKRVGFLRHSLPSVLIDWVLR